MDGAQENSTPGGIPGAAPPVLWLAMCTAVVLWWLWPWMDRWFSAYREFPKEDPPPGFRVASNAVAAGSRAERVAALEAEVTPYIYRQILSVQIRSIRIWA